MYLLLKINIFKMQLLKNGTADIIASTFFKPQITSILWRNCQLKGAVKKKCQFQKKIVLIGRRAPPLQTKGD